VKAKGNEGIANSIKTTPGSIGYVEYGYAKTTGLTFAKLQNKSGAYVEANTASGQAALATAVLPENLIAWIPDPEGANAYPIVTFTWMICYKKYDDANKANALKALITWCLDKGQETSEKLGYLPLPPNVIEKVKKVAEQIGS
jgi:phosphate transport system substrate-binding protein